MNESTDVPFIDLRRRYRRHAGEFGAAVERVLGSGRVLLGDELGELEQALAADLGASHVVAVASGASALELALRAMGVGVGDEVIVPSYTAVPTASAVCAVGAVPVPVDVELATAAVDPQAVLEAVTERTSAVVPVHLYGRPVDMSELATCGVPILEDGAQAHGATHGVVGQALALSFYPTKNLGGIGDGGAVVTDDAELADDVRRRRQHGMAEQYVHVEVSQNFRMSEIEAAWLRLTLPGLGAGNERRRSIARAYRAAAPWLDWQADHPDHVYHLCVARVPDRDDFRRRLASAGVGTAVQYPLSIGEQPAYRRFARTATPNAERWAAQCVSVPCFPELTDAEVEYVAAVLGASAP